MGSELGRGSRWGNMAVQLSGVERLVWPLPHMYTVGRELLRLFDDCTVGSVRHCWVEWSWGNGLRQSPAPRAAHSCSRGHNPELSSLYRNVLGGTGAKKGS